MIIPSQYRRRPFSDTSRYFRKNLVKNNRENQRTDENLGFYNGNITLDDIKLKVDSKEYAVAFILKPIPFNSIKKVADNNEILPPKSTYVEPKIRSGLTIYPLK